MAIKTIKEESLTALGNAIRAKTGSEDLLEFPNGMVDVIDGFNLVPDEAFVLTGNCNYRFYGGANQWLIDLYGDKITTNMSNADNMFTNNNAVTKIPFELNFISKSNPSSLFSGCSKLIQLPKITNLAGSSDMCRDCYNLVSLNGNQLIAPTSTFPADDMFSGCHSLRSIDNFFDNIPDVCSGHSIYGMYNMFYQCYILDELVNLPYLYLTYNSSSYGFGNCFVACSRLKEVTFRGGAVTSSSAKSTVLDLSTYVGYAQFAGYITDYGWLNEDTRVVDDLSYQALKNHPDWWTTDINYSRYNHDSAVNTLNSLPDFSSLSITMTIRFKGESGALTDGGAINTLTEEEIAVATAKGWTVTLV